jgi:hypothetical protein
LTGCVKVYASMQAHEGRALITALTIHVAKILTPWLLNLTLS